MTPRRRDRIATVRRIVHKVARDDKWSGESDAVDQSEVRFDRAMRPSAWVDSGNVLELRGRTSGRNARTCGVPNDLYCSSVDFYCTAAEVDYAVVHFYHTGCRKSDIRPYIVMTGTTCDECSTKKWRTLTYLLKKNFLARLIQILQ